MENEGCSCCRHEHTADSSVKYIDGNITLQDRLTRLLFRIGANRMKMKVSPGLYAIGSPGINAPVIVSANFKLTFDLVRSSVKDKDIWLLVLDTRGVNVWCAAGKGTFGTEELIRRIESSGLDRVVSHRRIILPQLGAPGIQAHIVEKQTGFRVYYGPVSARDLPEYLDSGMKATPEMRRKSFSLSERLELVPLECIQSWKVLVIFMAVSVILTLITRDSRGFSWIYDLLPPVIAVFSGAMITPVLLPVLPGRAFALKGAVTGGFLSVIFIMLFQPSLSRCIFIIGGVTALSSFIAMNFTGASTFTSLSGVRREMRTAIPIQITLGAVAVIGRIILEIVFKGGRFL